MLADPYVSKQLCTAATLTTDLSLPAISRADTSSQYRKIDFGGDGTVLDLFVGHQYAKRNRTTFRFTANAVVADPLVTGVSSQVSNSYYFVADESPLYLPSQRTVILNMLAIALLDINGAGPVINRVLSGET